MFTITMETKLQNIFEKYQKYIYNRSKWNIFYMGQKRPEHHREVKKCGDVPGISKSWPKQHCCLVGCTDKQ